MIDENIATGTVSELRPNTIESYEGGKTGIKTVKIIPGEKYGPLYRVDAEDFIIRQLDKTLRLNLTKVWYSRTDAVRKYACKHSEKVKNKSCLKFFLDANECHIEFDADFKLLSAIKKFFIEDAFSELGRIYQKVSPGRWAGYDQPKDFNEADRFYNLSYLQNKTELHLFQLELIYCKGKASFNPVLFHGKVKNGIKEQVRLNNHAIQLISNLREITNNGWPHRAAEKK